MTLLHDPAKLHPVTAKTLAMRASFRRTFNSYMARQCDKHRARPGQPCWTIPRDGRAPSMGVCGARINAARKAGRRAARAERVQPLQTPARALPRAAMTMRGR